MVGAVTSSGTWRVVAPSKDPRVTLEIETGRGLTQRMCNDVIDVSTHALESRDPAVEGSGRVTLAPAAAGPNPCGSHGSLRLEGVTAPDGARFAPIDIETDSIGCSAG